jgi:drug/metabolite transporter (DMT)-like permease
VTGTNRARFRGYALVLCGAVLFGVAASLSKLLLNMGLAPVELSFYSQLIAGLLFLPSVRRRMFVRRDWWILLFLGSVGGAVAPILFYVGIARTTAANAAMLQNGEPLFTIVFAYLLLGERVRRRGYAMIAAIAAGAFVVATNLDFSDAAFAPFLAGNLLLIGASAFWGLDNTASAVITRRVSIPAVLGVRLLLGCVFLIPVMVATNTSLALPADAISLLVGYSVLTIVVYATALYYAFRTIGPLRSGAVLSTSALWGVLFAVILFPNQLPSGTQLGGGAVMVLGLIGLYWLGETHSAEGPPTPEALNASAGDGPRSP